MEMLSCHLTVEFSAGTDIKKAVYEMIELSKRVRCTVQCTFNDVEVWAKPWNDVNELAEAYLKELRSTSALRKIACIMS